MCVIYQCGYKFTETIISLFLIEVGAAGVRCGEKNQVYLDKPPAGTPATPPQDGRAETDGNPLVLRPQLETEGRRRKSIQIFLCYSLHTFENWIVEAAIVDERATWHHRFSKSNVFQTWQILF